MHWLTSQIPSTPKPEPGEAGNQELNPGLSYWIDTTTGTINCSQGMYYQETGVQNTAQTEAPVHCSKCYSVNSSLTESG